MKFSRLNFFIIIAFIATPIKSDEPIINACLAPEISEASALFDISQTWNITTGQIEGQSGEEIKIKDKIKIVSGDNKITAGEVSYSEAGGAIRINKGLVLENKTLYVFAENAVIETKDNSAVISNTDYQFLSPQARGKADEIKINDNRSYNLINATYTTCNPIDNSWQLEAGEIEIFPDQGIAKNLILRVNNTPVLYLPYLSFPTSKERKSGILIPNFGSSSKKGVEINIPYYWNISPNMDLITSFNWMDKRGLQLENTFRFLTAKQQGKMQVNLLPDDKTMNEKREYINYNQFLNLSTQWRVNIEGEYTSDNQYFEDLTGNINSTSKTHLFRTIHLQGFSENWYMKMGMDSFQILDQSITSENRPHKILPYFNFNGHWNDENMGLMLGLNADVANFDSKINTSGTRFHLMPSISRTFNLDGIKIKPEVEIDLTSYDLNEVSNNIETSPNRAVPIYSLDIQALFAKSWDDGEHTQTLEPRILGVYIPFKEQNDFPVFDSILPDRNALELFRKNRYLGQDRVGDTSKLSYGITSKIYNDSSEVLSFTFGQTRYFKDRRIRLPGEVASDQDSSAYLTNMQWTINPKWKLQLGHIWSSENNQSVKTQFGFRYQSEESKIVNFSYRYRRNNIKQIDTSFSWPISNQWNIVGRYNYSIKDRKSLEHFLGVEYETCCWGIRAISRKHLIYRNGESDTSFSIQFIFKGLGEIGMPIENLLEDGILGYDVS